MTTARPLLMAAPMVRSTIEGIKTQTRRIVKPQPDLRVTEILLRDDGMWGGFGRACLPDPSPQWNIWRPMPFDVGDLLWVKESHYLTDDGHNEYAVFSADESKVREHAATLKRIKGTIPENIWERHAKLRPSIHMPRKYSRLTLELTDVRVERLQDISEEDAIAEGISKLANGQWHWLGSSAAPGQHGYHTPTGAYDVLWGDINGLASWPSNPWVWVLAFKVHHANVDTVLAQRAEVAA